MADSSSNCATYDHENPRVIIGKDCVARGHYDWSRSSLSDLGTVENVFMITFMIFSVYVLAKMAENCKEGAYHEWYNERYGIGRVNQLEDTIIQAFRINIFESKKSVSTD